MPSTFFGLDIGYTGLNIYNVSLDVTAHNITNAETDGYSRQQVLRKAGTPISIHSANGMVGTGVVSTGVSQIRDAYYDTKYWNNNKVLGEYKTKSYYMAAIENYFNEVKMEGGFKSNFDSLFTSMEEVSKDPSAGSTRTQMTHYGKSLGDYFNYMAESMKSLQEECNFELKNCVDNINSMARQVAELTKQINTIEVNGTAANDLRDARNLVIDRMSEMANIEVEEQKVGQSTDELSVGVTSYTVKLNGRYLVYDYGCNELELIPREKKINADDVDGLYDIEWSDGQNFDMYGGTLKGKLKGLIEVRDGNNDMNFRGMTTASAGSDTLTLTDTTVNDLMKLNIPAEGVLNIAGKEYNYTGWVINKNEDTGNFEYTFQLERELTDDLEDTSVMIGRNLDYKGIPYYMSQLNEFVRTFASSFNTIHRTGQDLNGEAGLDFFNATDVAGNNFDFTEINWEDGVTSSDATYYRMNASNFTVTDAIYKDPNKIAAASDLTQGVENKDIIDKLIALKSDANMFKQGRPAAFFETLIAEIGIDADKANNFTEAQADVVNAIANQRISISGVDTDEEGMSLIKYQTAYELSAKIISVMDEIYNKLINEMAV